MDCIISLLTWHDHTTEGTSADNHPAGKAHVYLLSW